MRRFVPRVVPTAAKALAPAVRSSGGNAASAPSEAMNGVAVVNTLPGVDLAKRVADPSIHFPATWSSDEPLAPSDPRVVWKEHYSLAEEKPYYHNVNTNETTWEIPEGFVTRFPQRYRGAGCRVDEKGAVFRRPSAERGANVTGTPAAAAAKEGAVDASSDAAATPGVKGKPLTHKQRLAAYGGGGLLWYLIVHNVCLATVFSLLYFFKVDLVAVARSYGFDVKLKKSEEVPEVTGKSKKHPPFFKTFVLSVILNKLLVPIQLVFTVATAPLLVHRLQPIARVLTPKCQAFLHDMKLKIKGSA